MIAIEPPASARSCPTAPLTRVDSLAALGLRVSRLFAQCRRQNAQLAMLWVEVDVLVHPGEADEADDGGTRDELLEAVSQRLRNRVRGVDEVLRVGEQSFAVLLPSAGSQESDIVERRLLQAVRGSYGLDERVVQLTVRVGRSLFPEHGRNGAELAAVARSLAA